MCRLIFRNAVPPYAKEYDSCFLLKFFQKEEYRDYYLSGNLYMKQQTEFSKEELGIGRFDITEGAKTVVMPNKADLFADVRFVNSNGKLCAQIIESKQRPENYVENQFFIYYPIENQKRNIFSMYALWCNREKEIISNFEKDKMKNFGEFGIIITNPYEFLQRVSIAAKKDKSIEQISCGYVNYIPEDQWENVMEMTPYIKPEKDFCWQNEFRICADTNNMDLLRLPLFQELRDISISIRLCDFAETAHYENDQLYFKAENI